MSDQTGMDTLTATTLITPAWLRARGACGEQVALLAQEWPNGAPVTRATLERALVLSLDIWWLSRFLPAPARRAYEEATASVRRAYEEATAPARRAYDEATASLRRAYEEAVITALLIAIRAQGGER